MTLPSARSVHCSRCPTPDPVATNVLQPRLMRSFAGLWEPHGRPDVAQLRRRHYTLGIEGAEDAIAVGHGEPGVPGVVIGKNSMNPSSEINASPSALSTAMKRRCRRRPN